MDGNQTYYGDHFTKYADIESLCHAPETNRKSYVSYTLRNQRKCNRKNKVKP